MFFSKQLSKRQLTLTEPDLAEKRNGRHLLVWKDVPHWMIVDDEFYQLLSRCRGRETLQAAFAGVTGQNALDRAVTAQIRQLISLGIINSDKTQQNQEKPTSQTIALENIAINITSKCNLRCSFCYNLDSLSTKKDNELTCDEIVSFLRKARPILSKTPSLALVGGEPLEYPGKVIAVATYAVKHGFSTLVSTNGTKITDEFARSAKEIGLEVQVSIDGHNADIVDALRGKGVFAKARSGIETLVEKGVYTIMCAVCHSGNFSHLKDFYELADSLGVSEARFIPLKKVGGGMRCQFKPVSTEKMIKKAASLFAENARLRRLLGRDCFTIIANTCRFSNKRYSCGTGLQTLLLDSDGSIYPCLNCNVPALRVANVREPGFDFLETWKNSPILNDVRRQTAIDNEDSPCSDCIVRYWCLGGCRGETYAPKGRLNDKANNCHDLRKSIIEMFWILADNSEWIKTVTHVG